MMRQGWSTSLFQASQQWVTRFSLDWKMRFLLADPLDRLRRSSVSGPHLHRGPLDVLLARDLIQQGREAFLKASTAPVAWA